MERIVHLELDGRRFTFSLDDVDGVQFWCVESEGKTWRSPATYSGNEIPESYFAALARAGMEHHGL
jgi:hypothetical protein